jgi:hypothetical protein
MPERDKQTATQLPKDADSQAIQILGLDERSALSATTPTQSRAALPSNCEVVRICLNVDAYILFGNSSVATTGSADGHMVTAGVEYFRIKDETHVSVLAVSDAGVGTISKLS